MVDIAMICPVTPFEATDGHRMAMASDVQAILDNKLSLGVVTFLYKQQAPSTVTACESRYFRVSAGSFATRFFRGLMSKVPPSSERLYTRESIAGVEKAISEWRPKIVVINDVSMAGYIPLIRDVAPATKIVIRTHNVMHDVRREQLARTKFPASIAVSFDTERYCRFERESLAQADAVWSITQADADRLTTLYKTRGDVLSVSIPLERYRRIATNEGDPHHFVHVGTLDFRRWNDLQSFLSTGWPKILEADPDAAITFAGALYGKAIETRGVRYAGTVGDDTTVYRQGRLALNIQKSTGGIKLKTLTSLAAGRTLVSTAHGVEGVPIISGQHYWDMEVFLKNSLKDVLDDSEGLKKVAENGRAWVEAHHSREVMATQLNQLVAAV
jgi:glycosyltransferase involved in cell wall biosynthesis